MTGQEGATNATPAPDPTSVCETEWAMPQCNNFHVVFVPLRLHTSTEEQS